ncbi:hypothetical protein GCM10009127_08280 [Alteraurantiacibacter aestuarii]|uniref:Nucleotide modification associated domain-containing protein n=1 Tax=Alteraurantiacibacter aestuarii TaxID=650004 RepID=A0A844ZJM2_9SPHN|nr:hypothetical protein [Alteraurantiacibacter aestuarii]MXO87220.1 hypothetical protein [Alteraurantiacibacter aestuarii]
MKIILSRKGFDSASGGGPSPIVEGIPVSLPIPAGEGRPGVPYGDLGLADHAALASRGRLGAADLAHHDPMFLPDGTCLFGQCGAAQSHLENCGVGAGDLFIFFGLFRQGRERAHHRIFGWLWVDDVVRSGEPAMEDLRALGHPHALAAHGANDAIYCGPGGTARSSHAELRLSVEDGPPSLWRVPAWMERSGLSYHGRADRWHGDGILQSVSRGQEFVADIGVGDAGDADAHEWAHRMLALMS